MSVNGVSASKDYPWYCGWLVSCKSNDEVDAVTGAAPKAAKASADKPAEAKVASNKKKIYPSFPLVACGAEATGNNYEDEYVPADGKDAAGADADADAFYSETQESKVPDPCDQDNDGYLFASYCGEGPYDCNDLSDKTYPGADEVPCNGVDEDCDGKDLTDIDGDGVSGCFNSSPKDCNDANPLIYPGATEILGDQIDQNCNGMNDEDWDGDTYTVLQGDCDDSKSNINPGAKDKICDTDLNCDGKIDEKDVDKDGYGACPWSNPFDCDDNNVNVHPGAQEIPCNDRDDNCDGQAMTDVDNDSDGAYANGFCGPADCDDNNPIVYPGAPELCDGIDNDCDTITDEGCAPTCVDADNDGYGKNCLPGPDCNDNNPAIFPGAQEVCNNKDDDCDNVIDENLAQTNYSGPFGTANIGLCKPEIKQCLNGSFVITQGEVTPKAEFCNYQDDNCDGQADELFNVGEECLVGSGACTNIGTLVCDNGGLNTICSADSLPSSPEICDGNDNNCDGQIDEGLTDIYYSGPQNTVGIGICTPSIKQCINGVWIDYQFEMLPQNEVCNNLDDNCNGQVDEDFFEMNYSGPPNTEWIGICKPEMKNCENGVIVITQAEVLPQLEIPCNGIDEDCNGEIETAKEWDKSFGDNSLNWFATAQQTIDGGYILIGIKAFDAWLIKTDFSGNKIWDKTFGGSKADIIYSGQLTNDEGYILCGYTYSSGAGDSDTWLIKTDSLGNKTWERTFGGSAKDTCTSVNQTNDGGYILTGKTHSYGAGNEDAWLIKTDSSGNKIWDKTFGGINIDNAQWGIQTKDGGYVLTGSTSSFTVGASDVWLIKTDSSGNKIWDKTFGGLDYDYADSVEQTNDGGYILTGMTRSYGAGNEDAWLIKTDSSGNKIWDKTFGGIYSDRTKSVRQVNDGGYLLCGRTFSFGAGNKDAWLIKTDSLGNKIWDKTFGESAGDECWTAYQTNDGGYILAGEAFSFGDTSGKAYAVKTCPILP